MDYQEFIASKRFMAKSYGFEVSELHPSLFEFQKDLVRWALAKGRSALFTMTGTGKTLMQCEWAKQVHLRTGGDVLILAPLAVSSQTVRESELIDLEVRLCKTQEDVKPGVNITNYERLHQFSPEQFSGIVLDESSILKAYTSKTKNQIIDLFLQTPYKLACTATPAPNDFMELGNHSEFLGVMSRTEMLSMFFVHDGGETQKWRLKGHAEEKFWEWVSSWGVVLSKPSDLGYSDEGFILPPLRIHDKEVYVDKTEEGSLFPGVAKGLQDRQRARMDSLEERCKLAAEIVNSSSEPFLMWCDRNAESSLLKKLIPDAIEVKGSDSNEHKERSMLGFSDGRIRVLVTKPSIAGFGMNWQHCSQMAFVGLSDSFEQYFQAVRRCWRFGQKKPVDVYVVTSNLEGAVTANIKRKEADAKEMLEGMVRFTQELTKKEIKKTTRELASYQAEKEMICPSWLKSQISI